MAIFIVPIGGTLLAVLWGFLNSCQLILYYPCFNDMSFSGNLIEFYKMYRPLSALDVLPTDYIFGGTFSFSNDLDKPYSGIFEEMGYETHNTILNIGTMYIWIIVI